MECVRRAGWVFAPERYDTAAATALRRDYYAEVAGRYWGRPATGAEVDSGLAGDGVELLAPPTGQFLVGRAGGPDGPPAACGGVLLLDGAEGLDGSDGLDGQRADGQQAELTRVFIRPAYRGTGGAALLMAALEEAAAGLGVRRLVLNTRLDLVEARRLYARAGYREIPPYGDAPYAEVWFGKELEAPRVPEPAPLPAASP
ncbi:GNAT family N-acetyltransferase [Streptomyces sp. NPDC047097]|uniref:GNAT family N-acetyltransferase n=1 Tax=Streptomyces sp. NPDC047097 TaxID=3155260 RepID=UPI0033C0A115